MPEDFFLLSDEHMIEGFAPLAGFKKYLFFRWFCFMLIAGCFILVFLASEIPELYMPLLMGEHFLFAISGVLATCVVLAFVFSHRAYSKRYYWVTTMRIVMQHGIIRTGMKIISLSSVDNLDVSHSLLEDWFGVPSLKVDSSDGNITMGGILFPEGIYLELKSLVRQRREAAGLVF
jgi:uncharacterized membrane protein YdbT with pleckstrin-like domain